MKGFLEKTFKANEVLFKEGQQGDAAYILTRGEVEISSTVAGRKKVLARLKPVSMFGEMALILEDNKRTATAMTTRESRMVFISRDNFEKALTDLPPTISTLINVLVSRLRTSTRNALRVPNLQQAVCQLLYLQLGMDDVRDAVDYRTFVSITANIFLSTVEEVEAVLDGFQENGILMHARSESGEPVLLVRDREKLREMSNRCQYVKHDSD